MLTLENVSKSFNTGTFSRAMFPAVRNVSFVVKPGEVVSLIGESGSGKTTIGKMILRLISITSGRIVLDGADVSAIRGSALKAYYRNVQGVFQDPFSSYNPIFRIYRAFDAIREEYFPDMHRDAWDDKVAATIESVQLDPRAALGKYPHQLSGGQLQRLLVARALLLDIKLLVADEIISMLDASTRIDVLNLLGDLKARGLGIIFITHDLSLGSYISDRSVILRHGAVVKSGATAKVFGNPQHPYTKMLLASVPQIHKPWQVSDYKAMWDAAAADGAEHSVVGKLVAVEDDHLVAES